jgi:hypothetical protein
MALDATDTFLRHYGIAGMRWGKRKSKSPSYNKSVKTFGGDRAHKNLNVSPKSVDAMKVHNYQARVKNAGTDALSTKELQSLVTRMNLEKQYSGLNPSRLSVGQQLVGTLGPLAWGALTSNYAARRPQRAPVAETPISTALATPSRKRLVGDILLATGKQLITNQTVQEQAMNIGWKIAQNMLK